MLILASKSKIRAQLLKQAGLSFSIYSSHLDEEPLKQKALHDNKTPFETALMLSDAKGISLYEQLRKDKTQDLKNKLIISADQTLSLENILLSKAENLKEAKDQLYKMQNKTHFLHSAVSLSKEGKILWSHCQTTSLTMRSLSKEQINLYCQKAGKEILSSVGCYQLEKEGVHLFEKIEGDYFTVLGLPLLALLCALNKYAPDTNFFKIESA